jgi:hypothetical protein
MQMKIEEMENANRIIKEVRRIEHDIEELKRFEIISGYTALVVLHEDDEPISFELDSNFAVSEIFTYLIKKLETELAKLKKEFEDM